MDGLDKIAEGIRADFDAQTGARDQALAQARKLTRHCAHAIRAIHRDDEAGAQEELKQASQLAASLRTDLADYPDLYFAGYTQDALKEFAEASIFIALVKKEDLPTPQDLQVESATYLKGLSEAAGELRRKCLDILRHGHSEEVERLLGQMDEIYSVLVTMDYPDAVTKGLRRLTDICRSLVERTRGDVTLSVRQERLEKSLRRAEERIQDLANDENG